MKEQPKNPFCCDEELPKGSTLRTECPHPEIPPETIDQLINSRHIEFSTKSKEMNKGPNPKDQTLENFMEEFFPFKEMEEIGFFSKEMKGDHKAQAEKVCKLFGYKTVYEYGAKEVRVHLSYAEGHEPEGEPFVTVIPSIYA